MKSYMQDAASRSSGRLLLRDDLLSTVIQRSWRPILSADGRRRAREHLLSLGHREEDLNPIEWPDDAVSAYQRHRGDPWQFITNADIRRNRQERAKERLTWVRGERFVTKVQPMYVWVFFCHGIGGEICNPWGKRVGGNLFCGWYTYLIGRGISVALNFRSNNWYLQDRVMELFPLVKAETLFDPPDFEKWMVEFAKKYQRYSPHFSCQGKAVVYAEVKNGHIQEITGKGKWSNG